MLKRELSKRNSLTHSYAANSIPNDIPNEMPSEESFVEVDNQITPA
jgi:hypothetical protein